MRFDGLSAELFIRVVERTARQPVALTASIEPRWSTVDNITGYAAPGYGVEFKLLADVVLSRQWYGAINVSYALGTQRFDIPGERWTNLSAANVAAGLARQVYANDKGFVKSVFVGGEVRYRSLFTGLGLDRLIGNAWFAGPSVAIGFPGERMLSIAWAPQIKGRTRNVDSPARLDLLFYERSEFRLKYATPFSL